MSEVIATRVVEAAVKYRFKTGFLGKQYLQVADILHDWDTNSGYDDDRTYTSWRNATRWEAENLLNILKPSGQK